jgi:diguanylate cyclase (GGDEF)-like protein
LRKILACLAGLLVAVSLGASAAAQQIVLRHFDAADGLGSLSVGALMQDKQGFIWAGTESGLFRYNGRAFERQGRESPVSGATIRAIVQQRSPTGTMVIATTADVFAGDGKSFTPIRVGNQPLRLGPGSSLAAEPNGDVLALARGQVWRLHPGTNDVWKVREAALPGLSPNTHLTGLHLAPNSSLWLVCDKHLCHSSAGGLQVFAEAAGVSADDWLSFLDDRQGRLWVRGTNHLIRLDPGKATFQEIDPPHVGLSSSFHYAPLAEDEQGRVLTRTDHGLARFDGGAWQEFTTSNGLSSLAVRHLLTDRQGAIWMSNSGRGVARWLGYDKIDSWTAAQGLAGEPVWQMVRMGKQLLINTSGGCSELNVATSIIRPCTISGLPPGEARQVIRTPSGDLWLNYPRALLHVPAGSSVALAVPGLSAAALIYADPRGNMWFAYAGYLLKLGAGADAIPQRIDLPAQALAPTAMAMDAVGHLWVAFEESIFTLADSAWTAQPFPRAPGITLQDIVVDGPILWAAGYPHGLLRGTVQNGRMAEASWVDSPLVNNEALMFARVDRRHRLWAGTEQGVVAFDGLRWQRMSLSDGLVWNDVDDGSFLEDDDGTVWIGTGNGLSHLRNIDALLAERPLGLSATAVSIGRHALRATDTPNGVEPAATAQWSDDRALTADLAVLNFDRSPTTNFRFRLVGTGENWFDTADNQLHYGNLSAGSYELQVQAIDTEHATQSPVLHVPFGVAPPWWRLPVIRLLECVAILSLLCVGLKLWIGRVNARRRSAEQQLAEHRLLLYKATHDSLTGLMNRGAIIDHLATEVAQAKAGKYPLAVVLIDIDHFKRVNDTYGHPAGDAVLRGLAQHIASQLRETDFLGRYGGEEMLAIMPGLAHASPVAVLERLRVSIAKLAILHLGISLSVTASLGVAWMYDDSDTIEALIERSDAALYAAKHGGRDRISYVAPLAA